MYVFVEGMGVALWLSQVEHCQLNAVCVVSVCFCIVACVLFLPVCMPTHSSMGEGTNLPCGLQNYQPALVLFVYVLLRFLALGCQHERELLQRMLGPSNQPFEYKQQLGHQESSLLVADVLVRDLVCVHVCTTP